jgi:hypothetical protein
MQVTSEAVNCFNMSSFQFAAHEYEPFPGFQTQGISTLAEQL